MLEDRGLFSQGPTSSNPFYSTEPHLILPDNRQTQCEQCNGNITENNPTNNMNIVLFSSFGEMLYFPFFQLMRSLYAYMHINSNKRKLMMK